MRRILLFTLASLALVAISLPARADSSSDTVDRYYRLQAAGLVT